jgi:hypothetical protein
VIVGGEEFSEHLVAAVAETVIRETDGTQTGVFDGLSSHDPFTPENVSDGVALRSSFSKPSCRVFDAPLVV